MYIFNSNRTNSNPSEALEAVEKSSAGNASKRVRQRSATTSVLGWARLPSMPFAKRSKSLSGVLQLTEAEQSPMPALTPQPDNAFDSDSSGDEEVSFRIYVRLHREDSHLHLDHRRRLRSAL